MFNIGVVKKFKTLIGLVVFLLIFKSAIISLFTTPIFTEIDSCPEYSQVTITEALHQRDWEVDISNTDYCMSYHITSELLEKASEEKNSLQNPTAASYREFWGELYRQLVESDQDRIQVIVDSLQQIVEANNLDYASFAHVVVKMVQDIPYQYVLSDHCTSEYNDYPCYGNQRFGITSPVEFLYTLKGDCDSRTVLIYTILQKFDYDPVVLISREYRHSMLALNIPAAGEFLKIDGKKYYFWETTGTGWEPGIIPPGMDNKNYWDIALKHEL